MRKTLKRLIATAMAAVTIAAPVKASAEDAGVCPRYYQVASNATGGDWVGGTLMYESTGTFSVSTTAPSTTLTVSVPLFTGTVGVSPTVTFSTTIPGPTTTTSVEMPIGFYKMVDGSVYEVNCITGTAVQIA